MSNTEKLNLVNGEYKTIGNKHRAFMIFNDTKTPISVEITKLFSVDSETYSIEVREENE